MESKSLAISILLLCSVVGVFVFLPLMLALLVMLAIDSIACLCFTITKSMTSAGLAALCCILLFSSLIFTDWGFSTPNPQIRIAWFPLTLALLGQLCLIFQPLLPSIPSRSPSAT